MLPLLALGALSTAAVAQDQPAPAPVASTPVPTTPFFSDVPRDHWAFAAVQKLAALGIIEGVPPRSTVSVVAKVSPAPAKVAVKAPVKKAVAAKTKQVR